MTSIAIVGAGGMARDALVTLDALGLSSRVAAFFESDEIWSARTVHGLPVKPMSALDAGAYEVLVAIGSSSGRESIVQRLPATTRYPTFVHPSVVRGRCVELGKGVIVSAGSILTTDIQVGDHVQINVACSITHDCRIGDFATLSPGVRLSGNSVIGRGVFIGTGACIREKLLVADGSVIGMGAVLTRSAVVSGTYLGCPAKRVAQ